MALPVRLLISSLALDFSYTSFHLTSDGIPQRNHRMSNTRCANRFFGPIFTVSPLHCIHQYPLHSDFGIESIVCGFPEYGAMRMGHDFLIITINIKHSSELVDYANKNFFEAVI